MTLANQKELKDKQLERRRELQIPDDVDEEEFVPKHFGECYFCQTRVSDFHFCYGCMNFCCTNCDVNPDVTRGHHVTEHAGVTSYT